jgi:hypothetical protein
MRVTCSVRIIHLDVMIIIIFYKYNSRSFSPCNFLQLPVTFSLRVKCPLQHPVSKSDLPSSGSAVVLNLFPDTGQHPPITINVAYRRYYRLASCSIINMDSLLKGHSNLLKCYYIKQEQG